MVVPAALPAPIPSPQCGCRALPSGAFLPVRGLLQYFSSLFAPAPEASSRPCPDCSAAWARHLWSLCGLKGTKKVGVSAPPHVWDPTSCPLLGPGSQRSSSDAWTTTKGPLQCLYSRPASPAHHARRPYLQLSPSPTVPGAPCPQPPALPCLETPARSSAGNWCLFLAGLGSVLSTAADGLYLAALMSLGWQTAA